MPNTMADARSSAESPAAAAATCTSAPADSKNTDTESGMMSLAQAAQHDVEDARTGNEQDHERGGDEPKQ